MDITLRLRGKRIASVTTNGAKIRITCEDGSEMDILWVNDNGLPVKGKPMIGNFGVRLAAEGVKDLIRSDLVRSI